jgi:hypothetical protein
MIKDQSERCMSQQKQWRGDDIDQSSGLVPLVGRKEATTESMIEKCEFFFQY